MRGPTGADLLYEAANVMLTRYKGQLKLKDWAFAIARPSTMRKASSLRFSGAAASDIRRKLPPIGRELLLSTRLN